MEKAKVLIADDEGRIRKLVRDFLVKEGYDVLIRDVSTLAFPSFRIIIPGMTEVTHSKMAGRFNEFEEILSGYYIRNSQPELALKFTYKVPPKGVSDYKGILILNKNYDDFVNIFNILSDLMYDISNIIKEIN